MSLVRLTIFFLGLVLSLSAPAYAQLAPTPNKAPRTPVKSTLLPGGNKPVLPASRLLAGKAVILDTERLKLDDIEMRLFGVVPPQMSAPLGPQARAVLDSLTEGDVTCEIRDRERSGPYLAVCKSSSGADFGLELLRRGLAVAARGTLRGTPLAESYLAAEQAAQLQRTGLWETKIPSAVTPEKVSKAAAEVEAAQRELDRLLAEKKETERKAKAVKDEIALLASASIDLEAAAGTAIPASVEEIPLPRAKPSELPMPVALGDSDRTIQSYAVPESAIEEDVAADTATEDKPFAPSAQSWLERNQIFATGLVALLSAFVIAGGFLVSRLRADKNDLRALAAALRGELMAARSIAKARLAKWSEENADNASAAWPRIRIIVFQAHVGKLGYLGAELARQVSSIYGQASDFSAYYTANDQTSELASKKQALQTLLDHIEEVLPRLESIEVTGSLPRPSAKAHVRTPLLTRIPSRRAAAPEGDGGSPVAIAAPKEVREKPSDTKKEAAARLANIKAEIMKDEHIRTAPEKKIAETAKKPAPVAMGHVDILLSSLKARANEAWENALTWLEQTKEKPEESHVPDYANLTEEELEALAESYFNENDFPKRRRFG